MVIMAVMKFQKSSVIFYEFEELFDATISEINEVNQQIRPNSR